MKLDNNVLYQMTNPHLLTTTIALTSDEHARMIQVVESQIETGNYHGGYTFEVVDAEGYTDFKDLYNTVLSLVTDIYGPFTLSPKNRNYCWANVYNKTNYRTNMHHHLRTSTVNSVFYLKIPEPGAGGLAIFNENVNDIFLPEEMDLVIMPSWLPHKPLPHNSDENRIAINMEFTCNENIKEVCAPYKIFQKCKINV